MKLEEAFQTFSSSLEDERKHLNELYKIHREKENKLKSGQDNLSKAKDRLFEVKTNKEYQAILKEIEAIETKRSDTEDEIIACLDEIDHREKALKEKEQEFKEYRIRYEADRRKIEEDIANLDAELVAAQQKIREIRKQLPESILRKYEMIKGLNNGLAVVSVWKEVCNGCHMNIPPQLYNDLQRSADLLSCPHCSRIIYWNSQGKDG
ncbi:MAG: hypothetical protein JW950_02975 [Deltaproteobacteria bacterium]|nr:hypothetical protein [Deltaproteobacteria bacterium]